MVFLISSGMVAPRKRSCRFSPETMKVEVGAVVAAAAVAVFVDGEGTAVEALVFDRFHQRIC
jgi:hypothetical protein